MDTPLISIIVPAYNQARYLNECLQSIMDQTFKKWECIIVDDGSPDNTENIVQTWLEKDTRFKYYKKQNGGVSTARNFGIEKASGQWILPLDGDDKIENQYLELASIHFEESDIVYCYAQYFGLRNDEFVLENFQIPNMLLENQIFCTAFFKKEDWKNIGGFDETMHKGYEDWDFWLSFISLKKQNIRITRLPYTGFLYRIKEVSRNTEAMEANDDEIRNYLYNKHQLLYKENISEFKNILYENRKLKQKVNHLEKLINSKRYQLTEKIFSIFRR
ncbi:glycosyl transferase family 2 [Chryseobacterium lactis]|uniref:Glycosyl transferase family 2 n=1 Tax=Chryseobacterium lactis TaxID=1241981 RepID=A0A3G6RSH9_CHRLC|nr:glycosyltransferase family A protein [Chryseobacterium lactis]AZA81725.1 glycosyltransferase family 2 protein [Chryseobacterium lactis]AZB06723.1 glycosyltransferase family 2 protein [Chryseobacterium lactis]PNW15574.1 glycosyl transferase family 2 [Chryseobacterium lactis]